MIAPYVIEECVQSSGAWSPAAILEGPYFDDLPRALGIIRALGSRRFRVRDTSIVQIMRAPTGRPIYISRTRDRFQDRVAAAGPLTRDTIARRGKPSTIRRLPRGMVSRLRRPGDHQ